MIQKFSSIDNDLPLIDQEILFTVGYDVIDITILTIIILNACAIVKLVKIVKPAPEKQELNIVPVTIQICCLILWTIVWMT